MIDENVKTAFSPDLNDQPSWYPQPKMYCNMRESFLLKFPIWCTMLSFSEALFTRHHRRLNRCAQKRSLQFFDLGAVVVSKRFYTPWCICIHPPIFHKDGCSQKHTNLLHSPEDTAHKLFSTGVKHLTQRKMTQRLFFCYLVHCSLLLAKQQTAVTNRFTISTRHRCDTLDGIVFCSQRKESCALGVNTCTLARHSPGFLNEVKLWNSQYDTSTPSLCWATQQGGGFVPACFGGCSDARGNSMGFIKKKMCVSDATIWQNKMDLSCVIRNLKLYVGEETHAPVDLAAGKMELWGCDVQSMLADNI